MEQLTPVIAMAAQQAVAAFAAWRASKSGQPSDESSKLQLGDVLDWSRPAKRAAVARASEEKSDIVPGATFTSLTQSVSGTTTGSDAMTLFATLPPEVIAKLMQARTLLSPEEQARAMRLIQAIPPESFKAALPEVAAMSADDLAAYLKQAIYETPGSRTRPQKENA
jgi:hypothetical protein